MGTRWTSQDWSGRPGDLEARKRLYCHDAILDHARAGTGLYWPDIARINRDSDNSYIRDDLPGNGPAGRRGHTTTSQYDTPSFTLFPALDSRNAISEVSRLAIRGIKVFVQSPGCDFVTVRTISGSGRYGPGDTAANNPCKRSCLPDCSLEDDTRWNW